MPTARSKRPALARTSRGISQYVIKIASRCDLSCDYCYVYEHADQGWRQQPRFIDPSTLRTTAHRIADHALDHGLPAVHVVLHGGEPLLIGAAGLADIGATLRRIVGSRTRLDLHLQSNGVLLTQAVCDVLVEHQIKVGISLDGDEQAHDRHRRFAHGAGSHRQVLNALSLLRTGRNRSSYAGLLCTVDLRNDPLSVYDALLAQEPPRIDFLLPHATWDTPPPRPAGEPHPYAVWLGAIYQRWRADGRPIPVRLFDSLVSLQAGGPSGTEAVGLEPVDVVVVETDGSFEQVDSLKVAYDGAARTGRDVFSSAVDDVAAHPMIAIRQIGLAGLSATCRACPVVDRCGGGQFAHRYRTGTGFDNPSVYCDDLKELIRMMDEHPVHAGDRIASWVRDDLASGPGEAESIAQLAPIHEAKVRAQLVTLSDWAGDGWDELDDLDGNSAAAVREVITYPFVRRWATAACETARRTGSADVSYLANVAAAAALQAGASISVRVRIENGTVALPSLGTLQCEGTDRWARLTTAPGGFTLDTDHRSQQVQLDQQQQAWRPVRQADLGATEVLLEDIDPGRDAYGSLPVTGRLSRQDFDEWHRRLDAAVASIHRDAPDYMDGIAATLRAVVPLKPDATGKQRSASTRACFGAVAMAITEPSALAILMIHEVQHLKLWALLDVCPMFDRGDRRQLSVPWKTGPRPLEGVLQGAYAFLAVADVWRRRPGARAREQYRTIRDWTDRTVDELLGEPDGRPLLNRDGRRFVGRMRTTMDRW